LQKAGVDFAILGAREACTGDPARRMGNEYVFQAYAEQNVSTLNEQGVTKIVASCPHCFNTLANEYGDFGGSYEVVHHTELLAELVEAASEEGQSGPSIEEADVIVAGGRGLGGPENFTLVEQLAEAMIEGGLVIEGDGLSEKD